MRFRSVVAAAVVSVLCGTGLYLHAPPTGAQTPARVDFARDVQPVLRQYCVGCHGPAQQMAGLRLDRRRDAMRGGAIPVIGPGNSAGSRLFLRVSSTAMGPQMPPTGALSAAHIDLIRRWIDEGADWPDAVAGDVPETMPHPVATGVIIALREGNRTGFMATLSARPEVANYKGPGGVTPLMAAVLYGDLADVRAVLERGADPNLRNDAGATALMWAAADVEKTRVLIDRGADVNAKSDDGRTPLLIAAGIPGAAPTVKLLLERGANPNASAAGLFGTTNPIAEAAYAGDAAIFNALVAAGAQAGDTTPFAIALAKQYGCDGCDLALAKGAPPQVISIAASVLGPPLGDGRAIEEMLARGADPNARDLAGRTLLMLAGASDAVPTSAVRALLARGADVHATLPDGRTALSFARTRGETPIVELLVKAGAKDDTPNLPVPSPRPASSARAAAERAIPLIERTDEAFLKKSGCVSCHNNSLASMTRAVARTRRVPMNDALARTQAAGIAKFLESWRERVIQGMGIPGDADTISYILLGLAADNHAPDMATDAMAYFLKTRQRPDGRWQVLAHRPPIESSDIEVTAASIRALQVYAPRARRAEYEQSIRRAAAWLTTAKPHSTEDRVFQLLGLKWTGADAATIAAAGRALLAEQRADGGFAQIPTLASDAYATGQALTALIESGAATPANPAVQRGVKYLLGTQLEDGSWLVRSRALPIQPQFDAGFPHGKDSWISAAATNWATMALLHAALTN